MIRLLKLLFLFLFPLSAVAQGIDPGSVVPKVVYGPTISACLQNPGLNRQLSTTVDQNSASGQVKLYIVATTNLAAGDVVVVAPTVPARKEACVVASVVSGDYVNCAANLTYTHLATDADVVKSSERVGPLTIGGYYSIYATDATGNLIEIRCLMGGLTVLADPVAPTAVTSVNGEIIPVGAKEIWEVSDSDHSYLSCIPISDTAYLNACKKR